MKVAALLLFTAMFANVALGQKANDSTANDSYRKHNYSSAIHQYKKLLQVNPCAFYLGEMLGICYEKTDSIAQEKKLFERMIYCPIGSDPFSDARDICERLGDIYLKEREYRKAITLYHFREKKWTSPGEDVNLMVFNLNNAVFLSKCYQGLNLTDSAVNVLTAHVFYNYFDFRGFMFCCAPQKQDTLKYDTICRRYLTLLQKLHSNKSIKAELAKADANFNYTEQWPQEAADDSFIWKDFKAGFGFYGTPVIFFQAKLGDKKKKLLADTARPEYTKAYQQDKFRHSPLYQMIINLPDK